MQQDSLVDMDIEMGDNDASEGSQSEQALQDEVGDLLKRVNKTPSFPTDPAHKRDAKPRHNQRGLVDKWFGGLKGGAVCLTGIVGSGTSSTVFRG